ncbi:Tm-1-like ATP-binding domain-containing protein, partial [Streptomyces sp. NPDC054835]
ELVGGVLSAGPRRLTAAGAAGIPQVVAPGALDMVNFGPEASVPERFAGRRLLVHNATVTLMRTTGAEMAELGTAIGRKLAAARGPAEVFWPRRGVSAVDVAGGPFADPDADAAGLQALRRAVAGSGVRIHELDAHVNDASFAVAMADRLHRLIGDHTPPAPAMAPAPAASRRTS